MTRTSPQKTGRSKKKFCLWLFSRSNLDSQFTRLELVYPLWLSNWITGVLWCCSAKFLQAVELYHLVTLHTMPLKPYLFAPWFFFCNDNKRGECQLLNVTISESLISRARMERLLKVSSLTSEYLSLFFSVCFFFRVFFFFFFFSFFLFSSFPFLFFPSNV